MAKIDIFKSLNKKADLRDSLMDLCQKWLESDLITDEQKIKIARLRSYIDINFKDF